MIKQHSDTIVECWKECEGKVYFAFAPHCMYNYKCVECIKLRNGQCFPDPFKFYFSRFFLLICRDIIEKTVVYELLENNKQYQETITFYKLHVGTHSTQKH